MCFMKDGLICPRSMSMQTEEQNSNAELFKKQTVQIDEAADLLVAYLEQLGIEYVFGVPGGAIEPLYNALARSEKRGGPRAVGARHESGAAFMAAGYASNSNKIGVCCSTTGPGATNLVTGVASAYQNNIPMLVITPQTTLSNFGKNALQESSCTGINTVGILNFCTDYNSLVSHVDQFETKLCSALITAWQNNKPAHLSIPLDIQRLPVNIKKPSYNLESVFQKDSPVDVDSVARLEKILIESSNTVFVIGEDCRHAIKEILNIALLINADVVTTPHAKSLVNPYHPSYKGVVGFAGHQSAIDALANKNVDTILAIGTSLSEWASNGWDEKILLNNKLVHIEMEKKHFIYSPMARGHLQGDIKHLFSRSFVKVFSACKSKAIYDNKVINSLADVKPIKDKLNNDQYQFSMQEYEKCNDKSTPIKPQALMAALPKIFPPHTRYVVDPGNSQTWAIHYLHPYDRRIKGHRDTKAGLFQSSLEFASMGWAIGNAVGVAIAKPDQPVVCITGDGSFLMSGQEITVAIQEELTVIYIILNDAALGMVKHGQRLADAEPTAFELPKIDYAAMARAMGVHSYVINSPDDLYELEMDTICGFKGPTLIDVRIDAEEVPPMGMRMKVLGSVL